MITTQKQSEFFENQRRGHDEKIHYRQMLPASENLANAGNKAAMANQSANQSACPDVEWRRSKSARFQQN